MEHRGDIDGLRALAVLPVLLFHAGVPGFSGGYVGVDVFFVISGYLITGIIAREIGAQRFSIARFYERRARRILPALTVMVGVTLIVAFVLMTPDDLFGTARSALATALFGSNWLFLHESGYFDAQAEVKPLLHTWSLAVEEQFYVVFPLVLAAIARLGLDLRLIVWLVLSASLAVAVADVRSDPTAAFYLLHARAFELLIGSVLALGAAPALPSGRAREIAAALGVGLILASVALFDRGTLFPGERALVPTLGAALVLAAGESGMRTRIGRLLATPPIAAIGLISYSLYLWHWPVIVLTRYQSGAAPTLAQSVGIVAASLALAALSWRFVEQPFRRPGRWPLPRVVGAAAAASLGLAALGAAGMAAAGDRLMPWTYGPASASLQRDARPIEPDPACINLGREALLARGCVFGARGQPASVALIGDSFAGSLLPALDGALEGKAVSALPFIWYSCPSILGTTRREAIAWAPGFVADCRAYVERSLAEILADPAIRFVVISNNYDWYLNGVSSINGEPILSADGPPLTGAANAGAIRDRLLATIFTLGRGGKTVVLVGMTPTGPDALGARARLRARGTDAGNADVVVPCHDAIAEVAAASRSALGPRFVAIDARRHFLAGEERCWLVRDGVPLTTDGSHATPAITAAIAADVAAAIASGAFAPAAATPVTQ